MRHIHRYTIVFALFLHVSKPAIAADESEFLTAHAMRADKYVKSINALVLSARIGAAALLGLSILAWTSEEVNDSPIFLIGAVTGWSAMEGAFHLIRSDYHTLQVLPLEGRLKVKILKTLSLIRDQIDLLPDQVKEQIELYRHNASVELLDLSTLPPEQAEDLLQTLAFVRWSITSPEAPDLLEDYKATPFGKKHVLRILSAMNALEEHYQKIGTESSATAAQSDKGTAPEMTGYSKLAEAFSPCRAALESGI